MDPAARLLSTSFEAIAHAAHRLDAVSADLCAQVTHVHLNNVRARVEVQPPHTAEQLLAAEHLIRVPQELLGQRELTRREVEQRSVHGDAACQQVELQTPHL